MKDSGRGVNHGTVWHTKDVDVEVDTAVRPDDLQTSDLSQSRISAVERVEWN